jgi:hypothetical protein
MVHLGTQIKLSILEVSQALGKNSTHTPRHFIEHMAYNSKQQNPELKNAT